MTDLDFKDKELITIKLPREDYEVLNTVIQERKMQSYIVSWLKNWWGLALIGSFITLFAFYDSIKVFFTRG